MAALELAHGKFGPEFLHYDVASARHLWPSLSLFRGIQECDPRTCLPCIAIEWCKIAGEELPIGPPMIRAQERPMWRSSGGEPAWLEEWNRPLLLAIALPPLIEQLGKTARKCLDKRETKEMDALKRRIEALEMRARWQ